MLPPCDINYFTMLLINCAGFWNRSIIFAMVSFFFLMCAGLRLNLMTAYTASGAEISQFFRDRISCRPVISIVILAELQQANSSYLWDNFLWCCVRLTLQCCFRIWASISLPGSVSLQIEAQACGELVWGSPTLCCIMQCIHDHKWFFISFINILYWQYAHWYPLVSVKVLIKTT